MSEDAGFLLRAAWDAKLEAHGVPLRGIRRGPALTIGARMGSKVSATKTRSSDIPKPLLKAARAESGTRAVVEPSHKSIATNSSKREEKISIREENPAPSRISNRRRLTATSACLASCAFDQDVGEIAI